MRLLLGLPLLSSIAIADIAPPKPMRKPNPAPGPMTPEPERTFADGPALEPAEALRTWLEAQKDAMGRPKRVRLPVVVTMKSPLGIDRTGHVGTEKGLALELDDTSMGVPLSDHVRRSAKGATSTVLLLDGLLVEGKTFRVLWVQPLKGAAPTVAQVEVTK
ncbi:MAG: hypothetical protein ABTQ32_17505 [Myxococcaceae bacterium]